MIHSGVREEFEGDYSARHLAFLLLDLPIEHLKYIDGHSIFDTCRMLVMNPNGMNEEIFFRIFLNRLSQGHIALVVMEAPDHAGSVATDRVNHVSFIHSENGEVYFDGLRADLNFLIKAFYYSRPTTLLFFALNPGGQDER